MHELKSNRMMWLEAYKNAVSFCCIATVEQLNARSPSVQLETDRPGVEARIHTETDRHNYYIHMHAHSALLYPLCGYIGLKV